LVKNILDRIEHLILLPGKGTERMLKILKENLPAENNSQSSFNFQLANDLKDAVYLARQKAKNGSVVLLSPGCTSFGSFSNEFERGDEFKSIVENLG